MMIVGGAAGAVLLIIGLMFLMSGGDKRTRPRPVAASTGGMSPEEARRLTKEGKVELAKGDALCRQAGGFGSPGYAAKINEARGHLNKAMESFNKIPDRLRGPAVEAPATQCARLLAICFKVPIETR